LEQTNCKNLNYQSFIFRRFIRGLPEQNSLESKDKYRNVKQEGIPVEEMEG
jgi:hypothetical protein